MIRDLKQLIVGHIEKGVLAICFLIFIIVLILQLTGGGENLGKAVEEHIKKIKETSQSVEVTKKNVTDYTKRMEDYWTLENREEAQIYTITPFVVLPGLITEPQKELKALPPEKVTAVAGVGRNVVVVKLPSQQVDLVHRASFEGKVLFRLYRKKGDDEDYSLALDKPYEALEAFQRQNYMYAILKDKLQTNKPLNPGDLDLAVALELITPQQAGALKKSKEEAPKPAPATRVGRIRRPTGTGTSRTTGTARRGRRRETEEAQRARTRREEQEDIERYEGEVRGRSKPRREQRKAAVDTVRRLTVAPVVVDLARALSLPLTLEDTDVEPDESYQYKVEVILQSPEKSTSAMSVASNMVKALSDIVIYLRGGTEDFASIEVRRWVAEVESWISKSFTSIKPGEAIGYPVEMRLRNEKGQFFVDAQGKFLKQEVDFSTGCTLVDLEQRVKFDPQKNLAKRETLRMAYLNSKGGLEYKWTERRKAAAIAAGAGRAARARSSRR